MDKSRTDMPELLSALEKLFKIAVKKTKMAPRIEDKTVEKLWKKTTSSLCVVFMYDTKCRVGVVQNLQTAEYIKRKKVSVWTVIWVAKHKLGFKRAATLVLDSKTMEHMDRYYMFRNKVQCRHRHTIPSREDGVLGEILQLSGKMIQKQIEIAAAYHDETTRATCADALQHSSVVAATHYRVGTGEDAIYQTGLLLNVKMSEIMTCSAIEDPSTLFNISIDLKPPSYADFTKYQMNKSKGLPFPQVKYDELLSRIQFSLIDGRAEVIARRAKTDNYSAANFGVGQLISIDQSLGKMFWVNEKKTEHLIIKKVRSIMENWAS